MAKNMNIIVKDILISGTGIAEILSKFQSIGIVLIRPNDGRIRMQQHRIRWKLIKSAKSTMKEN